MPPNFSILAQVHNVYQLFFPVSMNEAFLLNNLFFNSTSQYLAKSSGDLEVDFGPAVTALLLTNFPQA